jgi:hypothetical protein
MGLPNIVITFKSLANTAVRRLSRGTVGIIIRDPMDNGACILTRESQIETELKNLGAENRAYIRRAFTGYINMPSKVIVYVLAMQTAFSEALAFMATQRICYLVAPHDAGTSKTDIVTWIKEQRAIGSTPKAVLPDITADDPAIINFTTGDIAVGHELYSAAQYCSRIAGLIAGTPPSISCTYAALPEVTGVGILSKENMDAAIDAGQLILFSDGTKVKVARGVNSFVNGMGDTGRNAQFGKIKIVEIMDMINDDIRTTARDTYIGKFPNSYDNKCLLVSAINDYFNALEREGLLEKGRNTVGIDVEAQEEYLRENGVSTSEMSEQEIKESLTGSSVFLTATIGILDAIEDITLRITV